MSESQRQHGRGRGLGRGDQQGQGGSRRNGSRRHAVPDEVYNFLNNFL